MAMERWRPFGLTVDRWQPYRGLSDIQSEMNRMFDSVFGHPATPSTSERIWAPVCDLWETKDDLVVNFELPGISEKDVNVSITGDVLTVKGERRWQDVQKDDSYHRLERVYGKFERSVELPIPVQADKVKASYREGVLTVKLPKADEVKPRSIKIDVV
jgi:HSP20 family protein